jgi:hypothetical protein
MLAHGTDYTGRWSLAPQPRADADEAARAAHAKAMAIRSGNVYAEAVA